MNPALTATSTALLAVLVAGLVVALGVGLAVLLTSRRRLERELQSSRADLAALQGRLEQVEAAVEGPTTPRHEDAAPDHEYVITDLPEGLRTGPDLAAAQQRADGAAVSRREFASLAVSESVIRVAALAHGVRRALSPENRNRIGFEMRREVRRSRKQRRIEIRQTRRHLRAQDAA